MAEYDETLSWLSSQGFPVSEKLKNIVRDFYALFYHNFLSEGEFIELGLKRIVSRPSGMKHMPWQSIHYWADCLEVFLCPVALYVYHEKLCFFDELILVGENGKIYVGVDRGVYSFGDVADKESLGRLIQGKCKKVRLPDYLTPNHYPNYPSF